MPEMSMDVNLAPVMSESDESRQSNPTSLDKPHDASATELLACRSLGLTRVWSGDIATEVHESLRLHQSV
jgi:hypothetical protein